MPDAELTAVGSRSQARAAAFAQEHGFAAAYGSYEELLADESVDAVYVASPHALHVEHVTAAARGRQARAVREAAHAARRRRRGAVRAGAARGSGC